MLRDGKMTPMLLEHYAKTCAGHFKQEVVRAIAAVSSHQRLATNVSSSTVTQVLAVENDAFVPILRNIMSCFRHSIHVSVYQRKRPKLEVWWAWLMTVHSPASPNLQILIKMLWPFSLFQLMFFKTHILFQRTTSLEGPHPYNFLDDLFLLFK